MILLGIDNVFFEVGKIEEAIHWYQQIGFTLKFKIPHLKGALMNIGNEEPGLGLNQSDTVQPSRLWIEVPSAHEAQKLCESLDIPGQMIEPPTGSTFEISDPWGNKIGFADYSKKPELARQKK